ncbi:MAG: hypothetical protein AB7H48_06320 [Parachlamydiales bacterium]
MAVLNTSTSASISSSQPGPVQSQPLLTTQIIIGNKLYIVEAYLDDGHGNPLPSSVQYSRESLQQIKTHAQELFTAHELHHNTLNQGPLNVIGASSQGLIRHDRSTISHDFLVEPLDRAMAARIASEDTTLDASALKAQDIWNRLSTSILTGQTSPSLSTTSSPQALNTPPADLTTQADPLATSRSNTRSTPFAPSQSADPFNSDPLATPRSSTQANPLSPSHLDDPFHPSSTPRPTPQTDPLARNTTAIPTPITDDPLTTTTPIRPTATLTPPGDGAPVLSDPSTRTEQPLATPRIDDQTTAIPICPPRRIVLSTELQLKNHDFTADDWYETIPLRARLRICQNILKAQSIYPVERRVWERFKEIQQRQPTQGSAQTTLQLVQEEVRRLQQQCNAQTGGLSRRQRNRAEHFLKRYAQHAPAEELHDWIRRYRFNEQFFNFFEEQIEAEGLPIAETERAAWAREHYEEDMPRFVRVLERYLDSN